MPLTLDDIPVYIKEGAVIPAEKDGALYVLLVPADDVKNSFVLYDDDGESEQYKDGAYSEIELSLDGFNVTAKRSGNADFLGDDLILAVPASVKEVAGLCAEISRRRKFRFLKWRTVFPCKREKRSEYEQN